MSKFHNLMMCFLNKKTKTCWKTNATIAQIAHQVIWAASGMPAGGGGGGRGRAITSRGGGGVRAEIPPPKKKKKI